MIPRPTLLALGLFTLLISACGADDPGRLVPDPDDRPDAVAVSGFTQNLPTVMVIPSDGLLRRLGAMREEVLGDRTHRVRDYEKALSTDPELKFIVANIEQEFVSRGFPLENLEHQLKQLTNEAAMDEMEGIAKDARTMLLATARPDIAIDLDYEWRDDPNSRNPRDIITYSLTALDVHTNKSIAAVARQPEPSGGTTAASLVIAQDAKAAMPGFQQQLTARFGEMLANGTEITLRLSVDQSAPVSFSDERDGRTLAEWVNDYLKKQTENSTFKGVRNSSLEMRFTNVRIKNGRTDSKSYNAFDFASELRRELESRWGVKARNMTQSIGDAYLVISAGQPGGIQ